MQLPGSCRDLAAAHQRNLQHLCSKSRGGRVHVRSGACSARGLQGPCSQFKPDRQHQTFRLYTSLPVFATVYSSKDTSRGATPWPTLAHLSAGDGRSRHKLRGVL